MKIKSDLLVMLEIYKRWERKILDTKRKSPKKDDNREIKDEFK